MVELPAGTYDVTYASGRQDSNNCAVTFEVRACPKGPQQKCRSELNKQSEANLPFVGPTLVKLKDEVAGWHGHCKNFKTTRPFEETYAAGAKQFTLQAPTWIFCGLSNDYTSYGTFCEMKIQRTG